MIQRHLTEHARFCLSQFKAICIIGPRQSGKTTLSKKLLKAPYVNFENPSVEAELLSDPEAFVKRYRNGAIFDEVQRVPQLLRALQQILDEQKKPGKFILTGSQQLLLAAGITQSLAGRVGYLQLLPLSYAELVDAKLHHDNVLYHILNGGYPEIWSRKLQPGLWLSSYVQTYVQRDVRSLRNITNLQAFNKMIQLCATHAGQILNRDELARNAGVDTKTVEAWLGLLEASYIIFTVKPWFNNPNKRILKSPKIYFHDTGLLCQLLGIRTQKALKEFANYGAIFENWVMAEMLKNNYNKGENHSLHYLRDRTGNEIDLIVEREGVARGFEIKSGNKISTEMYRSIYFWQRTQSADRGAIIYGGKSAADGPNDSSVIPWTDIPFL